MMSEKVILTKEQDTIIKKALKNRNGDRAQLLEDHAKMRGCWIADYRVLDELTVSDMARVIYDGDYEIEQHKFQVGDMVTWDGLGEVLQISNIYSVGGKLSCNFESAAGCCLLDGLRHATEEEIYWLHELGRDDMGEFHAGDIIISSDFAYPYKVDALTNVGHTLSNKDAFDAWCRGNIKGIYPAESFKPLKKECSE